MGFLIRKSIKAGPFRFNLSGSGVGMSVGIRGLRVGTGPRGNYVHLGRGGLYYRATLSSRRSPAPRPPMPSAGQRRPELTETGRERFERIESANVLAMTDASAAGLLDQVRAAGSRAPMAALAGIASAFVIMLMIGGGAPAWLVILAAAIGATVAARVHVGDLAGRTVVLFYDLELDARAAYEALHTAFARLARAEGTWNVEARADTQDRRRNAGATGLVRRQPVRLGMTAPAVIRTNIDVPAIPCGRETLHFFPDRLLVSSPEGVGAVPYDQLEITVESVPFVEEERVPADASRVGTTWRYVNRNGTPDRRFADNRQLPILLYEQIAFTSPSGLREVLQLSATGGGHSFRSAVEKLGRLARVKPEDSARPAGGGAEQALPAKSSPVRDVPAEACEGGTPCELPRIPGRLPALAQTEEPGWMDADPYETGSLEGFASGVVEHLVMRVSLPRVLEIFTDAGLDEPEVHRPEALLFAALPFDALLGAGHFGVQAGAARAAFRRAVAARVARLAGVSAGTMASLVAARLDEYAAVVFKDGQLLVREDGMGELANRAYAHIVGGESEQYELLIALFTYFGSMSEALTYGERLAELHGLYQAYGDDTWEDDELP